MEVINNTFQLNNNTELINFIGQVILTFLNRQYLRLLTDLIFNISILKHFQTHVKYIYLYNKLPNKIYIIKLEPYLTQLKAMQPENSSSKIETQADANTSPQTIKFGAYNVFSIIKKSHNNYGIKNTDYRRYRRYCAHKIKKIRKSMAYKFGTKTKFVKKDIISDNQNDKKILDIALYNSQKYWAEANQTKYSPSRNITHKSRARFVSVKKLKKAIFWSNILCKISNQRATYLSNLQSNAYKYYLEGMLSFQQQNWNQAQIKLIAARQIMDELMKTSTSLTSELFKQKIDQFDQTIKFCNFKISKGKDMPISQIIEIKKIGDANLSSLIENLTQQRLNQISLQQNKDNNEIRFGNETYPIRQQKIQFQKSKIDSQIKSLQEIKAKSLNNIEDQQLCEQLLLFYSNIVVLIQEGIKITDQQRESGKKENKYNQGELQILRKVALLFQQMKISLFIDRSYTIFKHSYNTNKQRKSSPQTLAKLLTAINNNFLQLSEIIKEKHSLTGTSSMEQIKSIDEKAFYLRTLRLLFVGQVYFNNDKVKQAYGLWNQCDKALRILQSKQQMKNEKQKLQEQKDLLKINLLSLDKIGEQLKHSKLKCIIRNFKSDSKNKGQVTKMMEQINVKGQKLLGDITLQSLLYKQDSNVNISLEKLSQIDIIKLPGNLQPVPPRPIFFDIYQTQIVYPKLQGKIKPKSKWGGFLSKFIS